MASEKWNNLLLGLKITNYLFGSVQWLVQLRWLTVVLLGVRSGRIASVHMYVTPTYCMIERHFESLKLKAAFSNKILVSKLSSRLEIFFAVLMSFLNYLLPGPSNDSYLFPSYENINYLFFNFKSTKFKTKFSSQLAAALNVV